MSKLDELLRELCPNGVEYKKLGEIAAVLRGASPRPIKKYITNDSDGVNWIKIGDVPVGSKYITQSEEKITKEGAEKSRYVRKGDFILSNSMSFGRPYILAIDGCIHDGWLSISNFKDVFLSDYLYYLLSSSAIQQEMKKRASFGGAVQNLNADIVKAGQKPEDARSDSGVQPDKPYPEQHQDLWQYRLLPQPAKESGCGNFAVRR